MSVHSIIQDDEPTTVFFEPPPPPCRNVRTYEVQTTDLPVIAQRTLQPRRVGIGVGFAGLCLLVGVLVGCIIAFGTNRSAAIASSAAVAPAPAPVIMAPIVTPAPLPVSPRPATHVIRIESNPAGATVMLVDGGKSSLLGSTPLDAELDASHSYDLIFTLANRDTKIVHFDAATELRVTAALDLRKGS